MQRSFLLVLILFTLLLAACGAAEAPAAVEQASEAEAAAAVTAPESEADAGETAVDPTNADAGFTPATTAAEAGEVRPSDWTKGAPDAAITIIEYGDFQ